MAIRSLDRSTVPAWFTRLVVAGLGVLSILTILRLPTQLGTDPRENYLSVLGLVLPEATWTHSSVIVLATVFFGVGVVLWIALDRLTIIGACVTGLGGRDGASRMAYRFRRQRPNRSLDRRYTMGCRTWTVHRALH